MKIYNMTQKSEDWHKIRLGKFTASNFNIFMTDKISKTKEKELDKKASEIITGVLADSDFKNIHIERGIILEDEARNIYELETGNKVDLVGFVELDSFVGCSPDGLIGEDGIIEIKCKDNHTFFRTKIDGSISKQYFIQVQFQMMVCNRQWCDFVIYNQNFIKSIFIKRIIRDDNAIKEIKKYLEINIDELKNNLKKFNDK